MMRQWAMLLFVAINVHGQSFDHSIFDGLLRTYVEAKGRVNYAAWKRSDKGQLDHYLAKLNNAKPETLSANEKLAFWINAYNASAIEGVLERYPTRSIYQNSDKSFFEEKTHRVAGQSLSLDMIEKQILVPQFGDARLHFVLVCSAVGCPNLLNTAYRGNRVQSQMEEQTSRFVNDPQKVQIDKASGKLVLSKIFEWYEKDFAASTGSVGKFLAKYLHDKDVAAWVLSGDYTINYFDYNWALNDSGL